MDTLKSKIKLSFKLYVLLLGLSSSVHKSLGPNHTMKDLTTFTNISRYRSYLITFSSCDFVKLRQISQTQLYHR